MERGRAITGLLIGGALVAFGLLVFSMMATVRIAADSDVMARMFRRATLREHGEVRDAVQQIDSGTAPAVNLESAAGRVTVRTHDADRVDVMTIRRARGVSREDAMTAARAIEVEAGVRDGMVALRWWPEQRTENEQSVDWWITVPHQARLIGRSASGEAVLDGDLAALEWRGSFGDVTVAGARGTVSVTLGSGDVSVHDVVTDGDVRIQSEFGDIALDGVDASSIDLTSGSGTLDVDDVSSRGVLTAHTRFGDVSVSRTRAARYRLETNSGDVDLDGASGPLHLVSDFGDLRATDIRNGEPIMETGSGSVEYRGSLGTAAEAVFTTSFGSVDIWLPADIALLIDLETSFGSVISELPVTTEGRSSSRSLVGTVGDGGKARVEATSQSGNVTLHALPSDGAASSSGRPVDDR